MLETPPFFFFLGTALGGKDGIRMVVHCDNHGQDGNRMLLNRPWKPYAKQGHALTSKEELKLEMYRMALGLRADMLKCLRNTPAIFVALFFFFLERPSPPETS